MVGWVFDLDKEEYSWGKQRDSAKAEVWDHRATPPIR